MPRSRRIVVPDVPHHLVARGNRQQAIFFADADRSAYLKLLEDALRRHATRCLAWCLMSNHVHLILVPAHVDGLRGPIAAAHTAYSQRVNRTQQASGHLFQGRFWSSALTPAHLVAAIRYVENNPVSAGLVERAEDWRWSSARAHVGGRADGLTDLAATADLARNWSAYLRAGAEAADQVDGLNPLLGHAVYPPPPARRGRRPRSPVAPEKGDCPL